MKSNLQEARQHAQMFVDGRNMYYTLQHHPKYKGKSIVFPTNEQYADLAKTLDLLVSYVRKRVELFLFG